MPGIACKENLEGRALRDDPAKARTLGKVWTERKMCLIYVDRTALESYLVFAV